MLTLPNWGCALNETATDSYPGKFTWIVRRRREKIPLFFLSPVNMNETNITASLRCALIMEIMLLLASEFQDGITPQQH